MFGIKINNEFLDLPAATSVELERNNPFLSDTGIPGEYSLSLTINYSEKNYRLLRYIGNFYKKNNKTTIAASVYDEGAFRYGGQLVINQHTSSMNNVQETKWTGFFTIGASSFQQDINEVLLQNVNYEGDRSYTWTSANPSDGSGGFWQHIHAARVPNSFPYTFYPIRNTGYSAAFGTLWMNTPEDDGTNNFSSPRASEITMKWGNAISICPSIYVSYLLQQIFKNYGWKIDGEILSDIGFQKLTMPSFQAIKWVDFNYSVLDGGWVYTPYSTITFNLADHVPQNVTIGALLVAIKNRFGWWFDFDSNKKIAYLRSNKSLITGTIKDWTKYVQSAHSADYQDADKVYALINNVDGADTFPVIKEIDETTLGGRVANVAGLPTGSAALSGIIYFVLDENNYYSCGWDAGTSAYIWTFYSHNIGDYTPANYDATIESEISTMPVSKIAFRSPTVGLFPECYQQGNYWRSPEARTEWGMRFLFYHGMYNDSAGVAYPLASCVNTALSGTPTGAWVIPYRHEYTFTNDGSYNYWWKAWLALLSVQDTRTMILNLPVSVLKNFAFSDIIVINNVQFLVATIKEVLPYAGTIEMKMKRIY